MQRAENHAAWPPPSPVLITVESCPTHDRPTLPHIHATFKDKTMITLSAAQKARKSLLVRHINGEVSTKAVAITLGMTRRNVRKITVRF